MYCLLCRKFRCDISSTLLNDSSIHSLECLISSTLIIHIRPFLNQMVTSLFQLLHDVKQCQTKMQVLDVITLLFGEQVGKHMQAHADTLAKYLPTLWSSCDDSPQYGMLRTAIVRSLAEIVKALGPASLRLLPFICPVVLQSVDIALDHHVYLLEDGLTLWHTALKETPAMNEQFMQLFRFMMPLLERGDQSVKQCIHIIESYVLLGGVAFLQKYQAVLAQTLIKLAGHLPRDGLDALSRLCDTIIVAFPADGCKLMAPVLAFLLEHILTEFGKGTLASPGPIMLVLSRVLLVNTPAFLQLCQAVSGKLGGHDTLVPFFNCWLDKFEVLSNSPGDGKMVVLALTHALVQPQLRVYVEPRFALIVNVIVSGLLQYQKQAGEFLELDLMVRFSGPQSSASFTSENEIARRHGLAARDAVFTVNTRVAVAGTLEKIKAANQAAFTGLMATVDPSNIAQLKPFMEGPPS